MSPTKQKPWAIIVGAGPSGLLLGLLLAKQGIPVQIVDASNKLDEQPRATHYGPPAMAELHRAGVVDDMRAEGFLPDGVAWRKLDGTFLADIDINVLGDDPNRMVCLPLNRVGRILLDHIGRYPSATIAWDHKVISIGQDENKAWVNVETSEGPKTLEANYIIGCDGANSQVRRSLFGDKEFPGKTWDEQIVATNVSTYAIIYVVKRWANTVSSMSRRTTTSRRTNGTTPTSSSTQSTGTWRRESARTVCTASRTATFRACRMKNSASANRPSLRPSCRETRIQTSTRLSTSAHIASINGWRRACVSVASVWPPTLLTVSKIPLQPLSITATPRD